MLVPGKEFFDNPIVTPRYINKNFPEFYEYLMQKYPDIKSISEKLYLWKHGLETPPTCRVCGGPTKFNGIGKGYFDYCCYKCANSDPYKQEKTKRTCLKKYGASNPMQCQQVRDSFVNYFSVPENQEKIRQEREKKYGVRYTGQIPQVKEKIKQSCLEKYGVSSPIEIQKAKDNLQKSRIRRQTSRYEDVINCGLRDDVYMYQCRCPHPECTKCTDKSYWVETQMYFDRKRDKTEPCTHLLPARLHCGPSSLENMVCGWLDEYGINYVRSDRSVLKDKELDIYIPDKKIAIECNGEWYHCSLMRPYNYHVNKWKECNILGIQLISLWGVWINTKPEITKSLLLSKLGIYNERLYARKCVVKEISSSVCNKFLEENHIQGASKASVHLGLFNDDRLVSVMTFSKGIKCSGGKRKENVWDLARFCSLKGMQVVGAAGKLLKYFESKYNPSVVQSFSSNDISNGKLYESLGFEKGNINQSYWYYEFKSKKRYHRSAWTRGRLKQLGWLEDNKTEEQIMYDHHFVKNYDSGQIKWIKNINNHGNN